MTSIQKTFILLFILGPGSLELKAQEGFWVPEEVPEAWTKEIRQLADIEEKDGLTIYPDLIRSTVYLDNGNCSGVLISKNGLLLTNYHCLEPYLNNLQKEGKIDLESGYFISNDNEGPELIGLTADLPVKSQDLSMLSREEQGKWLDEKTHPIEKRLIRNYYPSEKHSVGKIFHNFQKITLVAAPPRSLATLGGNEANWEWPRYSSDFCILRIHKTEPAHHRDYKEFPHLEVGRSISRNQEVYVAGYPFLTYRNSNSRKVKNLLNEQGTRLKLRKKRLNIYSDYLEFNPDTRLPHSLMTSLENEKVFQENEIKNVRRKGLIEEKHAAEQNAIRTNQDYSFEDFERLSSLYDSLEYYNLPRVYLNEGLTAPKIFMLVFGFSPLEDALSSDESNNLQAIKEALKGKAEVYYAGNDLRLEKELFFKMVMQYYEDIPSSLHSPSFKAIELAFNGDVFLFANEVWENSIFTDEELLDQFLIDPDLEKLRADPMYQWVNDVINFYFINIAPQIKSYSAQIASLESKFDELIRKTDYPEANGSLRFSRGAVKKFFRNETDQSEPFCTANGLITAFNGTIFPEKVQTWLNTLSGNEVISFLSEVEVTGGNSGSPIMDNNGRLIGMAFDQNIEGLGNRFFFEPSSQKCIGISFAWIEKMVRELGELPGFFEREFNQ